MNMFPAYKPKEIEPYYVVGLKVNSESRFLALGHFEDIEHEAIKSFVVTNSEQALTFKSVSDFFSFIIEEKTLWDAFLKTNQFSVYDFQILEIRQGQSIQTEVKVGIDISI